MTNKVLGVLAALSMVVGSVACSSSSTDPTGTPDTGKADAKTDGATDTGGPKPTDGGGGDSEGGIPENPDKTTGKECKDHPDCDVTGEGRAYCTNKLYVVGPLNPTPVCMQLDSGGGDVCTPTDDTTIRFCDGNTGLCTKSGTNPATCDPMCVMDAAGAWVTKCAGLNACNAEVFGTASDGKVNLIGTCQGGCTKDADCPTGSKCDPIQKFCAKTCTSDTQCKSGWSSAPANWKCDTARGACTFQYAKKLGEFCASPASGGVQECLCLKRTADPQGICIDLCKTGDATGCPTGFTCDALLPTKDKDGKPVFSFTTQPAGLSGYCIKNCTDASACPTGWVCEASAGLTQKTCRPPASTGG